MVLKQIQSILERCKYFTVQRDGPWGSSFILNQSRPSAFVNTELCASRADVYLFGPSRRDVTRSERHFGSGSVVAEGGLPPTFLPTDRSRKKSSLRSPSGWELSVLPCSVGLPLGRWTVVRCYVGGLLVVRSPLGGDSGLDDSGLESVHC